MEQQKTKTQTAINTKHTVKGKGEHKTQGTQINVKARGPKTVNKK